MEINVMDENEVRHMYMQGYTVKQIGEIMYNQAQKRLILNKLEDKKP